MVDNAPPAIPQARFPSRRGKPEPDDVEPPITGQKKCARLAFSLHPLAGKRGEYNARFAHARRRPYQRHGAVLGYDAIGYRIVIGLPLSREFNDRMNGTAFSTHFAGAGYRLA